MQHVLISTAGGVAQYLVSHKATVDIAKLLVRPSPGGVGNTHPAPHPHLARRYARRIGPLARAVPVHGHRARQKISSQHIGQASVQRRTLLRALDCGGLRFVFGAFFESDVASAPLLCHLAVVPDGKTNIRANQRVAANRLDAMCQFGGVGF